MTARAVPVASAQRPEERAHVANRSTASPGNPPSVHSPNFSVIQAS